MYLGISDRVECGKREEKQCVNINKILAVFPTSELLILQVDALKVRCSATSMFWLKMDKTSSRVRPP